MINHQKLLRLCAHYLMLAVVLVGVPYVCCLLSGNDDILTLVRTVAPKTNDWGSHPELLWNCRRSFAWWAFAAIGAVVAGWAVPFSVRFLRRALCASVSDLGDAGARLRRLSAVWHGMCGRGGLDVAGAGRSERRCEMTQKTKDILTTVGFEITMFFGKLIVLFPIGYFVLMIIGCAAWGEAPWSWIIMLTASSIYSLFAIFLLFGLPFWLYGRPHCTKFWKRVLVSALIVYCIAAMVCWDILGRSGVLGWQWHPSIRAARIATTVCAPLNLPTVGVLWVTMKCVQHVR